MAMIISIEKVITIVMGNAAWKYELTMESQ